MGFLDRFTRDTTSPDAFTLEVATRIRVRDDVASVEMIDADTVAVTWAGRTAPERFDLSGTRQPWKDASGFGRIEVIDAFMATLAPSAGDEAHATADSWEVVAADVLPVLRRRGDGDGAAIGETEITWSITALLEATVAVGSEGTPVTDALCERWGMTAADIRARAEANLAALDPRPDPIAPDARAWVPTAPDGLQSSWLAAPQALLSSVGLTEGIVLAPVRGELVVVDPADRALTESVISTTLTIVEQEPETLCPVPFRVTPDEVSVWEPPADDPVTVLLRRAAELLER